MAGIAAKSGNAPANPGQPMPPPGAAPPSGTPMTPVPGDGNMLIPSYGFPPPIPSGYYYGAPPNLPAQTGMPPAHLGYAARYTGYDSSDDARRNGSVTVKDVEDLLRFVIDTRFGSVSL